MAAARAIHRVAESSAARKLKAHLPTSQVTLPPSSSDPDFDPSYAALASRILFRSGTDPSGSGPLYVLCAAALPDPKTTDYDQLLPYVLSCLPTEDELSDKALGGGEYSLVFFAGSRVDGKTHRPPWGWILQAYYLLGRAVRKKIRRLWIVHERSWVRILIEMLQNVVSPKFRRKIVHITDLSDLANSLDITKIDIPLQVYLHDRRVTPAITIPNPPPPVFGSPPFPPSGASTADIPFVLTHTARYLRIDGIQVEGIFRIAASKQVLDIAEEAYNRRQKIRLSDYGPHVAAGLVKLYYRTLPEPLIPSELYDDLEEYAGKGSTYSKEEVLKRFLKTDESKGGLPESSRELLLRHLLPLLSLVAQHSEQNKMSASNLAVCISASLVRSEDIMKDTAIARGPVMQLIQWGIEEVESLCPELPARRGSSGEGEQKVITTPVRKAVPGAEVSTRDASKVADYFEFPAVPEIRQQPVVPSKPMPLMKQRQQPAGCVMQQQQQVHQQMVQQQQQRNVNTPSAPSIPPPIPPPSKFSSITPPALSPKSIPEPSLSKPAPTPPATLTPATTPSKTTLSPSTTLPLRQRSPSTATPSTSLAPPRVIPRRGSFTVQVEPPPPPSYAPPKTLRKLSSSSALGSAYLRGIAAQIPDASSSIDLSTPRRPSRTSLGGGANGERHGGMSKTPPPPASKTLEVLKPRRVMTDIGPRNGVAKKLASAGMVEELRRLYEERAGAGKVLVSATRRGVV